MLIMNVAFNLVTNTGETLQVNPIDALPVVIKDVSPKVLRFAVNNPLPREVVLPSFKSEVTGQGLEHVLSEVSDDIPFTIPANGSKVATLVVDPLQSWIRRTAMLTTLSSTEV